MQIGRRIYYDIATGNVIVDTGERKGNVVETTNEQDFAAYAALAERVPETVGHIELEYGQYAQDFADSDGYRVNPVTQELEFTYPDPNDPDPPEEPVYQEPLSEKVARLEQEDITNKLALAELHALILGGGTNG